MNEDGKIIIGTELDTTGFNYGIKDLEKETQNKISKLGLEKQFEKGFNELNKTLNNTYPQIEELGMKLGELVEEYNFFANIKPGDPYFQSDINKAEELKQEIIEVSKQIENLTGEKIYFKGITDTTNDFKNINNSLKTIGNSVENVIKKVGKWALAIFGISSAYNLVRSAMSTLSQYNDQMATDVEYIRYLLASTLQPVIETLINLAYKLLTYINYIAKAWFNVDLFANASVGAFNKANKSANALKKTLSGASFDKFNALTDSSSADGGGGESVSPSFDLSNIEDMEAPEWLDKIVEIGEWILDNWEDVVGMLLLTKLFIDLITGNWIGVIIDVIGFLILAFFKIKDSVVELWNVLSKWLKEKWTKFVEWINEKINEIQEKWTSFKEKVSEVWQSIIDFVVEKWTKFKDWIYQNIIEPIGNFFVELWNGIVNSFNSAIEWIKNTFNNVVDFFKSIINTIVNLFKNIGTKVGDVIGGAFKAVINGVLGAIESILNFPIRSINKLIGVINKVPGINLGTLQTFKLPRMGKGGILNMPGRGVDYYSANIAERGPEAVIPMTNQQSLETIGRTIAKYTKFDANVTLELEGRILARVMQEINSDRNFARNGG